MNISFFLKLFAFFFGVTIGSFLNAVIYRIPRNISISLPRSRCTACGKVIYWYENIPILSWIFLRAKCSGCSSRISIRYPLIELVTGIFAYAYAPSLINAYSLTLFFYQLSLFSLFLCILLIDIDFKIIPNSLNIYLAFILLIFNFFTLNFNHSFLGFLIGLLFPLGVTWIFYLIRGKIGLGGGDIKLYAVLGIVLGPVGIIQNIFLSCFIGALVGVIFILTRVMDRNTPIPFGPYIVVVASLQLLWPSVFRSFWKTIFVY